jgi:hypothetical protein
MVSGCAFGFTQTMSDLGPAVGAIFELLSPIVGPVFKAMFRTVFGMVALVSFAVIGSVWFASQGSMLRGLLAATLCLVSGAIVTGVLVMKNGMLRGLLAAVERVSIGKKTLSLVFSKLGVDESGANENRTGLLGTAERIPLAQAQAKLQTVVQSVLQERAEKTGFRAWISRKLMYALLERVEALTLARFRDENASSGGVNLLKVRDELGGSIDSMIGLQVQSQANRLNMLIAGGYALGAALIGLGVSKLNI